MPKCEVSSGATIDLHHLATGGEQYAWSFIHGVSGLIVGEVSRVLEKVAHRPTEAAEVSDHPLAKRQTALARFERGDVAVPLADRILVPLTGTDVATALAAAMRFASNANALAEPLG
jgi:hypothetical protein